MLLGFGRAVVVGDTRIDILTIDDAWPPLRLIRPIGNDGEIVLETGNYPKDGGSQVSKSVPVTQAQFQAIQQAVTQLATEQARFDYALFGHSQTCAHFANNVYQATGHPGSVGDLFSFEDQQSAAAPVWSFIPGYNPTIPLAGPGPQPIEGPDYVPTGPIVDHVVDPGGIPLDQCFASGTEILLADGQTLPIEDIRSGMMVASFTSDEFGRSSLTSQKVVRLYRNVTDQFLELTFEDGRPAVYVTPGHAFLDETGSFTKIGDLLRLGGGAARIVDASGQLLNVQARTLLYSAENKHLFDQAGKEHVATGSGAAAAVLPSEGWQTYNFEVAEHHTYVAGSVRNHNEARVLDQIVDRNYKQFYEKLKRICFQSCLA